MARQHPRILIINGTVVNDDQIFSADVLIDDGKIKEVGPDLKVQSREHLRVIDARGRLVIPGGIDPHTHFQLPMMGEVSIDDFYQGTSAALAGGTTMVIDFVIPSKDSTPIAAYRQWRKWADPKVCCDYALSMAITTWSDAVANEMEKLVQPDYGINSFKFFLAYRGMFMVQDDEFFHGLKQCAKLGALARVHAENGHVIAERQQELLGLGITGPEGHTQSRPEELEREATNRACVLADLANCPLYVVHVMSRGAAEVIAQHRQKGQVLFGEPIAAGLAREGSAYYSDDWTYAAGHVLSPPLSRDPTTPEALMNLLASGQLHLTGTDNCTFTCAQRRRGLDDFSKIPNGVNGVEDRMSVVWENGVHKGKLDPMRFVAVTSTTAAKIFNFYPRKGRIQAGSDADVVIWNPNTTRTISAKTHHQAGDFNIFEGMTCHGVAETTISQGKVVWESGKLNVEAGSGRFIALAPNCPFVFGNAERLAEAKKPRKVERTMSHKLE